MRNFWQVLKGLGVAILVVPILAVGLFIGYLWMHQEARPPSDPSCFYSKTILIKIGSHLFNIPRNAYQAPYLEGENIPLEPRNKEVCYRNGEPPINVTSVTILNMPIKDVPEEGIPLYDIGYKRKKEDFYYIPTLELKTCLQEKCEDSFVAIKEQLEKENKKLTELPKEGNFYVLNDKTYKSIKYYIAVENDFVTPEGNPMVVMCSLSNGGDGKYNDCSGAYVLKDGVAVVINRLIESVPLEDWPDFYRAVRAFVEGLEVTNNK